MYSTQTACMRLEGLQCVQTVETILQNSLQRRWREWCDPATHNSPTWAQSCIMLSAAAERPSFDAYHHKRGDAKTREYGTHITHTQWSCTSPSVFVQKRQDKKLRETCWVVVHMTQPFLNGTVFDLILYSPLNSFKNTAMVMFGTLLPISYSVEDMAE